MERVVASERWSHDRLSRIQPWAVAATTVDSKSVRLHSDQKEPRHWRSPNAIVTRPHRANAEAMVIGKLFHGKGIFLCAKSFDVTLSVP